MPEIPLTVKSLSDELRFAFRDAGMDTAELDTRIILSHILKLSQARLLSEPKTSISSHDAAAIRRAKQRRLHHEPVSRIIGEKEFWGRPFEISPSTLDPRPDTETLIEATLKIIHEKIPEKEQISILDLGTGSGCILLTLLAECQNSWGLGIDINETALVTAKSNAERHDLGDRANFLCADWASALNAEFDIVISNPPYINSDDINELMPEVRKFDPLQALDGGPDGLDAYRQIITNLNTILTSGWVILELGAGQLEDVSELLKSSNFAHKNSERLIFSDLSGTIRTVAAKQHFAK